MDNYRYTKDSINPERSFEAARINKYLSDAGMCSRREADRLICEGKVLVDGQTAVMGQKVFPWQKVVCNGKEILSDDELTVIAFNKPVGVECTTDKSNPCNIVDYINYPSRIFPIGRLDKNSSGLILLTNTGILSEKILRGSNNHEKEYAVTVDHKITPEFVNRMETGVKITLEDGRKSAVTKPCAVKKTGNCSFRIILTQGLNRQIRRMCLASGYKVISLKRIRIMNIKLDDLAEGSYRKLSSEELEELLSELGLLKG